MISPKETLSLLKQAAAAWKKDRSPSMGAALAYYTAFSLAPLLLLVIGVASLVFGRDAAQAAILGQLQGLLGADGGEVIEAMLTSAGDLGSGVVKTVVGVLLLLIGATTAFVELQDDLDRIWKAPPRVGSGILNLIRSRLLSIGMILGIGFLLTVSLVMSAAVSALGNYLFAGMEVLLQAANFVISFAIITVLFAMIYKILPNVEIQWRDVWLGAAITALLFAIGKFLIGAAGPFVIIMLWIFYSTQIFLLGAEFTSIYAGRNSPQKAQAPGVQPASGAEVPAPAVPARRPIAQAPSEATYVIGAGGHIVRHPYRRVALSVVGGLIGGVLVGALLPEKFRLEQAKRHLAPANLAAAVRNTLQRWRMQ
jgi:membrane protein